MAAAGWHDPFVTLASLAMYPFAHLRETQNALWAEIRRHLGEAPDTLDFDTELHAAWHRPDLLLGQTCGWPLVTELEGEAEVVGTFAVDVPFASADGHYRSVLVARKPISLADWQATPDVHVARNNSDSLSGWVSLCAAWGGIPQRVTETGAHLESMRAVAEGRVDVAMIDAVSLQFIAEQEPFVAARVHIIGHGPRIPCLPLVMAKGLASRRDEMRAALGAAMADPTLASARSRLRISGFVPLDAAAYEPVRALMPQSAG
jgi:ABC-type phosphate/phosphonate transport system substrate-binding protein